LKLLLSVFIVALFFSVNNAFASGGPTITPEPLSMALFLLGAGAIVVGRLRKR
jgi:hypothetical protein